MKKNKLIIFLLMCIFMLPITVHAEDKIKFSVTKSVDSVKPNGTFNVIVNETGATDLNSLTGYTLKISYETSKLEYVGNAEGNSSVTIDGGVITVSNNSVDLKSDSELARFVMRVIPSASAGSTNLNVTTELCQVNGTNDSKNEYCEKPNSASVKIDALGTDATLSSLKIPNATLTPSFNKDVTSYTSKISDITELSVNAVPTDSNARVEITDNYRNLQKGDNKIQVVVTSEDGNHSKTYTVNVKLTLTPTEEELVKSDASLKALKIKDQKIDFDSKEKKYYLTVDYKTTSLDITATPTNSKAKVKIEGNKKLIVGKNTIKVTVTSEDETKNEVYQVLVTRKDQEKEVVLTCPDETSNREWIIFTISMLIIFTLGLVLGYILGKLNVLGKIFKKKKKEEPVEVDTFSDTINLGDSLVDLNEAFKDNEPKDEVIETIDNDVENK